MLWVLSGLGIIITSSLIYLIALPSCGDNWPIPYPAIIRINQFHLETDQGKLHIGQTYNHRNEGPWVGSLTPLFVYPNNALLLIRYPKIDDGFSVGRCKVNLH
jgi:hypothetical protein